MWNKTALLLVIGFLAGIAVSCTQQKSGGDAKVQASGTEAGSELPVVIAKGDKIQYRTASGGWNVGSKTPTVEEVRKRWIRVKGEGFTDQSDDAERWVSVDHIIWYRIVK